MGIPPCGICRKVPGNNLMGVMIRIVLGGLSGSKVTTAKPLKPGCPDEFVKHSKIFYAARNTIAPRSPPLRLQYNGLFYDISPRAQSLTGTKLWPCTEASPIDSVIRRILGKIHNKLKQWNGSQHDGNKSCRINVGILELLASIYRVARQCSKSINARLSDFLS